MDFSRNEVSPLKRYGGIGIVILVHLVVAYVLINSLSGKLTNTEQKPVEVKIIAEIPPPPPKIIPPPPPPKVVVPPRQAFVPKVEQEIKPPPTPDAIQNKTETKPPPEQKFEPIPDASVPPPKSPPPAASPTLGLSKPAIVDLNACLPVYPRLSKKEGDEGTARVKFDIGAEGELVSATITKSSGFQELDDATKKALSRCKFKPAYQDGRPVASSFTVDYKWTIKDDE